MSIKGRESMFAQEQADAVAEGDDVPVESRILSSMHRCSHILHHRKGRKQQGQGRILRILLSRGTMTQRELLDLASVRSASLSELLGKMESNGYIVRAKNAEDKRSIDITLTDQGREAAAQLEHDREETARRLFSTLQDDEKLCLESILAKLLDAWQEERLDEMSYILVSDRNVE